MERVWAGTEGGKIREPGYETGEERRKIRSEGRWSRDERWRTLESGTRAEASRTAPSWPSLRNDVVLSYYISRHVSLSAPVFKTVTYPAGQTDLLPDKLLYFVTLKKNPHTNHGRLWRRWCPCYLVVICVGLSVLVDGRTVTHDGDLTTTGQCQSEAVGYGLLGPAWVVSPISERSGLGRVPFIRESVR